MAQAISPIVTDGRWRSGRKVDDEDRAVMGSWNLGFTSKLSPDPNQVARVGP
jgi:hypothetical protein